MLAPVFQMLLNLISAIPTVGPTIVAIINGGISVISVSTGLINAFLQLIGYQ